MAIKLITATPHGKIIDAPQPIAVTARVAFTLDPNRLSYVDNAWVLAWTKGEVLVAWRDEEVATVAWLPAADVRRRSD